MPAGEIRKSILVLQELWLTSACKILAEITGTPFEVEDTRETDAHRPLGVCAEFQISGGFQGRIVFGIPSASREISELLLLEKDEEGRNETKGETKGKSKGKTEGKSWTGFSAKTAQQWLELVHAETGLVCAIQPSLRDLDSAAQGDEHAGLFSRLKSDKIVLPVYLLVESAPDPVKPDPVKKLRKRKSPGEPEREDAPTANRASNPAPDLDLYPAPNLDLLLDIELQASLRFGSREMPLSEILEMVPGDVVPLDRPVDAPVDLVVGDRIVARGEVVLVDGNYGLRVTEVAEPRKRLETVRCLF